MTTIGSPSVTLYKGCCLQEVKECNKCAEPDDDKFIKLLTGKWQKASYGEDQARSAKMPHNLQLTPTELYKETVV